MTTDEKKGDILYCLIACKNPHDIHTAGKISVKTGVNDKLVRRYRAKFGRAIDLVNNMRTLHEAEIIALKAQIEQLKAGVSVGIYPQPRPTQSSTEPKEHVTAQYTMLEIQDSSLQLMQSLGMLQILD